MRPYSHLRCYGNLHDCQTKTAWLLNRYWLKAGRPTTTDSLATRNIPFDGAHNTGGTLAASLVLYPHLERRKLAYAG